ncbi:MAG: hypothetical protein ACR2N4_17005 [Jatrophihabitans sp.]
MPDQILKRGAIPSPRSALAASPPHVAGIGAPPNALTKPAQLSMWGNDVHGDCVTAEEAFAKACHGPEIFISEAEVIAWATKHGVLEGAYLTQVMTWMQTDGFTQNSTVYDDGPYQSVDWTHAATLQSAISQGPVKLGVAADQIETAWHSTGGKTGWFGTGWHADANEDHCVALCGYGTISWLADQLGASVPAGLDGNQPGYALYTWDSIGIVDASSVVAVTHEAWLRQPTTLIGTRWSANDLTSAAGAPAAASDPFGYTWDVDSTEHVVYGGVDGHVHELWFNGSWHHNDLSVASHAPAGAAPAGGPYGYTWSVDHTQHVVFRGVDGHVHELWFNGSWHHNDLSTAAAAPLASGGVAGYTWSVDSTEHVVYRGVDGHVHELWFNGSWHHNDLTNAAGAPIATGNPAGYTWSVDSTQHVVYRGADGHVHELWFDGSWHHNDLTGAAGAPLATGNPFGYTWSVDSTQHVVYRGADGHIHELWFSGGWHHNDLTAAAGGPSLAGSDPFGYTWDVDSTQHVVYRGADGHIHELWFSGGWHHNDLTTAAGNPGAAVGRPAGYTWSVDRTEHVVYRRSDSHVIELYL